MRNRMKNLIKLFPLVLLFTGSVAMADDDIARQQQELDAICEAEREKRIAPMREEAIEECVTVQGKDRDYCTRFYRDFGERAGDRPAFFYDLPECVAAFEFKKNNSRR